MPLCISCRGEYGIPAGNGNGGKKQPQTDRPPSPLEQLSSTKSPEPDLSSEEKAGSKSPAPLDAIVEPYVCIRCGQNNQRWHEWASASGFAHFNRFFFYSLPWGWLALGSFALPVLAAWLIDFTPVASERIGVPLAVLLIFVNFALLYALKDSLWRYDLLSRVGRGFRPQLALLGIIFFVMALIFGLVIVFMIEALGAGHPAGIPMNAPAAAEAGPSADVPPPPAESAAEAGAPAAETAEQPPAPRIEGLLRVATTILLAFTFVNVTLSAMFMAAHDYSQWLNREMPQPIYAQERRLLAVIEDGLGEQIRQAAGKDRVSGTEKSVATTIVGIERTDDAGMILMLNAETDLRFGIGRDSLRQLQSWRIETDRWGRIIQMGQVGDPRYVAVERASINGGVREPDEIIFSN